MINSLKICPMLLIVLLLIGTIAVSTYGLTGNKIASDRIYPGVVNIKIASSIAPLKIREHQGIIKTGCAPLDLVAESYRVYKIEKSFRMKKTPVDPKIPDLSRWYTARFPDDINPQIVADAYAKCLDVEIAETAPKTKLEYEPNDPRYRDQWHLEHCGLPRAWDVTHGSEEIIVGIIDGGIEMNIDDEMIIHEDLEANLWINTGEDIDDDGRITLDDWNERDDDDNGYIDDFYGWDFGSNDNWPDDYWDYGHGSHVAGDVSAVTDNEIGVAGAGFNCKLMICANYWIEEPGYVNEWWRAVEYCVDNGVGIINFSFGSIHEPRQIEANAVEYALENGCIIFASAGNNRQYIREGDGEHHYPSDYNGVIAVAGCNQNDIKYNLSNYGDFIDLVAPAENVLAPWDNNTYSSRPGTSVASPIAAGIGALALSIRPDLNAGELLAWMQETAVDISGRNEDFPGIQYRVDAGSLLRSTVPEYMLLEHSFLEIEGDGDGNLDMNEIVGLSMTIANDEGHPDSENVMVRLENDDGHINIQNGETNIGNLDSGNQLELTEEQYLTFRISNNSPIHYTTFHVIISGDDGWLQTFDLTIAVPHPLYLLVDDDDGATFESYYHDDMLERPIVHHVWNVAENGAPPLDVLNSYSFTVWETGNSEIPLSEEEQTVISDYLDSGRCLLISGQFIGDDIGETAFHTNYLKARHTADDVGDRQLNGVEGNALTDGLTVMLLGADGAGNGGVSPSAMEPLDGAEPILTWRNGEVGGIHYSGDYHLVYLGFAMEAIGGAANSVLRRELLEIILDHFYRLLDVETLEPSVLPSKYSLYVPSPNPFNASATVRYDLPAPGHVSLSLYDLSGRLVATLVDGEQPAGRHAVELDGSGLAAGVYFIRLETRLASKSGHTQDVQQSSVGRTILSRTQKAVIVK